MPELLQDSITVSHNGDDFVFSIPSIHDEVRIGLKARALRQALVGPGGDVSEDGLDRWTVYMLRACATFEVLLRKSSAMWPWTAQAGGPVVDSGKFPDDKVNDVLAIYSDQQEQLLSFREGGVATVSAGTEAVAGQSDTGDVPVQS